MSTFKEDCDTKGNISLSRRAVGLGIGGLLALGLMPPLFAGNSATTKRQYWISAQGEDLNSYALAWGGDTNNSSRAVQSGFRGHGAAQHPLYPERVIMFARRPGNRGVELALESGRVTGRFECEKDRHLFGHGCFSADGKALFTSEADYKNGVGKIAVRDAKNYQLLGEYESYGIGPHELKMLPDGKTLVVANGGILTRPDSGRKKLNLKTMRSRLTYIDSHNGQQLASFQVPEKKASIRHLDVAEDGSVVFAMQIQRDVAGHEGTVPLAGVHKPEGSLRLFDQPSQVIAGMRDYMGSVAINSDTRVAGFTSPRGNLAAFWHIDTGEFVAYHQLRDVCGIAVTVDKKEFVVSNSLGQLRYLDARTFEEIREKRIQVPKMRLDNHLLIASMS